MIKTLFAYGAIAVGAIGVTAAALPASDLTAKEEARLTRELAGRTPGEARSCVRQSDLGASRTYGDQAIMFDGPGSLIYVNNLRGGCPGLKLGRSIRVKTTSSNLCTGDIAFAFEPVSGVDYGACPLGEFVPYRRGG